MRLSRTDLLPVLAIIGGGAVGLATSASLVLSSRSDYVPAPVSVVAPPVTAELATDERRGVSTQLWIRYVEATAIGGTDGAGTFALSPDGRWLAYTSDETSGNDLTYASCRPLIRIDYRCRPTVTEVDGEWIYFQADPTDGRALWRIRGDGSGLESVIESGN